MQKEETHLNARAMLPTMGTHGSDGMSSHGLAASIVVAPACTSVDCWRHDRDNWCALDSVLIPLTAISLLSYDIMTLHSIAACWNEIIRFQVLLSHIQLNSENTTLDICINLAGKVNLHLTILE